MSNLRTSDNQATSRGAKQNKKIDLALLHHYEMISSVIPAWSLYILEIAIGSLLSCPPYKRSILMATHCNIELSNKIFTGTAEGTGHKIVFFDRNNNCVFPK